MQYQGYRPQQTTPPMRRKKHTFLKVLLALALLGGAVFGAYYGLAYLQVRQYENVFLPNIAIDGISLSGHTLEEGRALVLRNMDERQSAWSVNLVYNGHTYTTFNYAMMGITTDYRQAEELIGQAWNYGHRSASALDIRSDADALAATPFVAYTLQIGTVDSSLYLDNYLSIIKNSVSYPAVDATYLGFNPDADEPFAFTDEVYGATLDTEQVKLQMLQMLAEKRSGDLVMQLTPVAPAVTKASLQENYALRAIGTTPIDPASTENRTNNIRVCFNKINGLVIGSNETFSFNRRVGMRTYSNGFFTAQEYAYGELVDGVGGGSCQASTTVYLAALTANMKITDRAAHSGSVSYTALGQDATVYWISGREIDFKFKNTSGGSIYMTAHVVKDPKNKKRLQCVVKIYGKSLGENVNYRIVSITDRVLSEPYEKEYIKDATGEHTSLSKPEVLRSSAKKGYVVSTYLQRIENGVMVGETKVSTDTYPAVKAKYWVYAGS